ncbi:uncharacterized protein LOC126691311 [Quercus robur]|uniref:uncharacterized protein LOC126691311 n=1 Tax=Quercus robur TaxID=38942 RepID=UPI002163B76B|nr:uncharacterized protein LOC126691311 [Quercus robur]
MYNEIEGNYDDVTISTFKRGLSTKHGLRKSLTRKPVTSVRQLMDRIDKYKKVEEDQQTGKGKAKAVHAVFREPLHKILEKVKSEPFFQWPSRMAGDPSKHNQNLYCAYHQEPGHITDDCRNLKNHLNRLVQEGKLRHLLHHPVGWREQSNIETRQSTLRPPIGTINVILAAPGRTGSSPLRVMSVGRLPPEADDRESKRARAMATPLIGLSDKDKLGTLQPHDDALVITLRIGGYDMKKVLVDQGNAVEVMYPDLYKGLNLKPEDLSAYDSPLVSFEGKTVTPKGMIRLPIQTDSDMVEVDFIVNVDVFAWDAYKAPGVDPDFICHHLNVSPAVTPKKQPPQRPLKEYADAVREEVTKLKKVGAIKENAESTCQRMMTRMFEQQMGKSIEVYIDDMVVKSKLVTNHVRDLGYIF